MFWFYQDLERLENQIQELDYNPKLIFYGSSTFTLWDKLPVIFKNYNPLNLGLGGLLWHHALGFLIVFLKT